MSERRKRSRPVAVIKFPTATARRVAWDANYPNTVTARYSGEIPPIVGIQVTESEGHPWYSRDKREKTKDIGGDFYTYRQYSTQRFGFPLWDMEAGQNGTSVFFRGPIVAMGVAPGQKPLFPPAEPFDNMSLDTLGATAVARCKPTNAIADLSTFLGELMKEGLPSLIGAQFWSEKVNFFRGIGKEYLNVEFGWKPLLNEILSLAEAIRRAKTALKQLERDNGKVVRRKYTFPVETDFTTTYVGDHPAYFRLEMSDLRNTVKQGAQYRTRHRVCQTWFSGAFTYHLPPEYFREGIEKLSVQADLLVNSDLTPETIWNLAPWSWAVDWFSNTGDVISNMEDHIRYSLVMPYGYLMRKVITTDTFHFADPAPAIQRGNIQGWSPLTLVTETKIRKRAHPYGFGVKWEGLDPRQIAILTAIGITR